jgi:hypothetical protein
MKYSATTTVQTLTFAPLQSVTFRNNGSVNVFVALGPVPNPLPDLPSQGYSGTPVIADAQWCQWNGWQIKPGEQLALTSSGTGMARIYSLVAASSTAEVVIIPEF